jgi:hypothetical protein
MGKFANLVLDTKLNPPNIEQSVGNVVLELE